MQLMTVFGDGLCKWTAATIIDESIFGARAIWQGPLGAPQRVALARFWIGKIVRLGIVCYKGQLLVFHQLLEMSRQHGLLGGAFLFLRKQLRGEILVSSGECGDHQQKV